MAALLSLLRDSLDSDRRAEFWATLALRYAEGLGARSRTRLLRTFRSALEALQHPERWPEAGISARKGHLLSGGSWRQEARKEWDSALRTRAHLLLWGDVLYPPQLRELPDAPPLLYYRGDPALLSGPCLAIVGARRCTSDGVRITSSIAKSLAACGVTIVSGMALGIDRVAHQSALSQVGRSVAVLGAGLDMDYPKKNREIRRAMETLGCVVSEFAPNVPPNTLNFPVRNRVISGLSLGVLVVEATARSGSLITARHALEQNRQVYAIPGAAFDHAYEGCQELIRQGAQPIFTADDILLDLAPQLQASDGTKIPLPLKAPGGGKALSPPIQQPAVPSAAPPALPPDRSGDPACDVQNLDALDVDARRILKTLTALGQCHMDTLCQNLSISVEQLSNLLVTLEMDGHVRRLPGAFYVRREA